MDLIKALKGLGDETRLRILNVLRHGKMCVCEIEYILGISQSNASRHLIKLKDANIINHEKTSKWVYYFIEEEAIKKNPYLELIINNELEKIKFLKKDIEVLKKYRCSGVTCDQIKVGEAPNINRMECEHVEQ